MTRFQTGSEHPLRLPEVDHGRRHGKSRRMLLPMFLLIAVLAVFAGCGGGESSSATAGGSSTEASGSSDKPVRVGFFLLGSANSWSQAQLEAAKEKAKELGDVTVTEFDGGFDPSKQVNQIQDATTSGKFDAFLVSANSGVALQGVVEQALQQGIKVIATYEAIGADLNTVEPQVEGLTGTVILPPVDQGKQAGESVVKACEGIDPCKIAYIGNGIGTPSEDEKKKGFESVLTPNVKIVATSPNAGFLASGGLKAAEDILQANPDLSGIFTSSDQSTAGAEEALKNAGKTTKDVFLASMGCATTGVEAVEEGRWVGTACTVPIDIAQRAMEIAVQAVHGEKLPPAETQVNVLDLPSFPKGADKAALEAVDFKGQYAG